MAEELHSFHLNSVWNGDSNGDGALQVGGRTVDYGVPEDLGGKAGRSNPEEMLLGAVASCYSITLAVLAERRKLPGARIEMSADAEVVRQPGGTLKYRSIRLHPKIMMAQPDE